MQICIVVHSSVLHVTCRPVHTGSAIGSAAHIGQAAQATYRQSVIADACCQVLGNSMVAGRETLHCTRKQSHLLWFH